MNNEELAERIKNLEIAVAYLTKAIERMADVVCQDKIEYHTHITYDYTAVVKILREKGLI